MEMLRFGSILLLFAATLCVYAADNAPPLNDSPGNNETTISTVASTSAPTKETESTAVVSSSTEPDSTTGLATDSSTTEEPTKTTPEITTVTPLTTERPKAPAMADPGTWELMDNGTTCMKLHLAAQFQTATEYVNLPAEALVNNDSSSCKAANETQQLTLFWHANATEPTYTVTFVFALKNVTDASDKRKVYHLTDVQFQIYHMNETKDVLAGHTGNSYKCNAEETIDLTDNAKAIFKDVQVQAFMGSSTFGTAEQCPADDKSNDIVPIAVGCALAGLVIIVLIAYVIGRRVTRQKGYQSV